MSAFVVENDLIDALVSYWLRSQVHSPSLWKLKSPDEWGQILVNENYRSVNYRYRAEFEIPPYKHVDFFGRINPVEIIKACNCYDYQACETDNYEKTQAAEFVAYVRREAISALPGYEQAIWGMRPNAARRPLAEDIRANTAN